MVERAITLEKLIKKRRYNFIAKKIEKSSILQNSNLITPKIISIFFWSTVFLLVTSLSLGIIQIKLLDLLIYQTMVY